MLLQKSVYNVEDICFILVRGNEYYVLCIKVMWARIGQGGRGFEIVLLWYYLRVYSVGRGVLGKVNIYERGFYYAFLGLERGFE